jgi:ATP-binding cassette subfamily F protein 3
VVADHTVTSYDGDLDDYRRTVLSARGARSVSRERGPERSERSDPNTRRPKESLKEKRVPLKQRISDAEAEIARIAGIIAKIDAALALPDLFKRDPRQAAQLGKARASATDALTQAEEEWLAASSDFDEATG